MPVRTYSQGMKARLTFGLSMGIAFDTYLVDEVTATGDAGFRAKSHAIFRDRIKRAGALIVSHNMEELRTSSATRPSCSQAARRSTSNGRGRYRGPPRHLGVLTASGRGATHRIDRIRQSRPPHFDPWIRRITRSSSRRLVLGWTCRN
jgi:hypothetical protein